MSQTIRVQVAIAAPVSTVFRALTDPAELTAWFAEHAVVDPATDTYACWGPSLPESGRRENGRQHLLTFEPNRALSYHWHVFDAETTVAIELTEDADGTAIELVHEGVPARTYRRSGLSDFWSLALLNLKVWSERRGSGARHDFSTVPYGDVRLGIDIAAPRTTVYPALIEPELLDQYIATGATVEPWVGGKFDFGWDHGPVRVLELLPDEKLAYSWTFPPIAPTVVTWELAESDGQTRLTLVHSGFAPDEESEGYTIGWLDFLLRLKLLVEAPTTWHCPVVATAAYIAA